MNGKLMEKSIGDVWNSVDDLCQKYTCEMGPNGEALEKSFREYCLHSCHNVCCVNFVCRECVICIGFFCFHAIGLRFSAEERPMLWRMCKTTVLNEQ